MCKSSVESEEDWEILERFGKRYLLLVESELEAIIFESEVFGRKRQLDFSSFFKFSLVVKIFSGEES